MKKSEVKLVNNALDWVKAALDCKDWIWDGDQRDCAEIELKTAREILARYADPSIPKPNLPTPTKQEGLTNE